MWCLKQFRYVILKFSISGSFFSEKFFLKFCTMILVSFRLGRCGDEVTVNGTDYQGYKYMFICISITH